MFIFQNPPVIHSGHAGARRELYPGSGDGHYEQNVKNSRTCKWSWTKQSIKAVNKQPRTPRAGYYFARIRRKSVLIHLLDCSYTIGPMSGWLPSLNTSTFKTKMQWAYSNESKVETKLFFICAGYFIFNTSFKVLFKHYLIAYKMSQIDHFWL